MIANPRSEYFREYRRRNRGRRNESNRKWLKSHPEKAAEYYRKYKDKHRLTIIAWERENRDKVLAKYRRYRANHKEKIRDQHRKRLDDPVRYARIIARHNMRAARKRGATVEDTRAYEAAIRLKKSVACFYCGMVLPGSDCHIDHVTALSLGGPHAIRNLVPSCPSCNLRKSNKPANEFITNGNLLLPLS